MGWCTCGDNEKRTSGYILEARRRADERGFCPNCHGPIGVFNWWWSDELHQLVCSNCSKDPNLHCTMEC